VSAARAKAKAATPAYAKRSAVEHLRTSEA
jgi:hypothetical protein